ncbi:NAD+ synthase [Gammaproteobacteria bacterium]|nr:NAD+ synthase [Gammaproteobacteria bacterium]
MNLRIVLSQLKFSVGNIQNNLIQIIDAANLSRDSFLADIIVFPELTLTGYPPEDLLFRNDFLKESDDALNKIRETVKDIYCVVGHPHKTNEGLYNACSVIYNNKILGTYFKQHLPNYSVFDENRYFISGNKTCIVNIKNIPVGITICEDIWFDEPIKNAANGGAKIILSPNASPFEIEKHEKRQSILAERALKANLPIIYVNNVGGQDDLIFDGGSMIINNEGSICQHAGFFEEVLLPCDIEFNSTETKVRQQPIEIPDKIERIYKALTLSVRDYVNNNNFNGALIGVSGGIDSALSLSIAVDALGKKNVKAIFMPSRYTSKESEEDALELINNLNIQYEIISIETVFEAFLQTLQPIFSGTKKDTTEENLQARCRGMILMAISNKTGRIVLTTSNRSEFAVGYSTLYGDMAGGFCILKDVPKQLVYKLSEYKNEFKEVIPKRILEKPPTAELAPNQKDEDSLPPYHILDEIIRLYLNQELSIDEIAAHNFDKEIVEKIVNLIHKSEYKRGQAPLGPRIDNKSFGRDHRYPITSGFKK